jgi:hypothetical protein
MSDNIQVFKAVVAAEAVISSEAFFARKAEIASIEDKLAKLKAEAEVDTAAFVTAYEAAVAVGDADAFARGVAAARQSLAAEAEPAPEPTKAIEIAYEPTLAEVPAPADRAPVAVEVTVDNQAVVGPL